MQNLAEIIGWALACSLPVVLAGAIIIRLARSWSLALSMVVLVLIPTLATFTGVLGASQSGLRSSLDSLRVLRDEETIVAARAEAEQMVAADASLERWPLLAAEVDVWEQDRKSEFMERS